jgi:putative ABC transport system substrate-binding protein
VRGQSPGAIPIERPVRFTLVVNLKTAASLGLIVPGSRLAQADRVLE